MVQLEGGEFLIGNDDPIGLPADGEPLRAIALKPFALDLIVVAKVLLLGGRDQIEQVVALTVLLSALLHGVTAAPLSRVYARRVERMPADAPEKRGAIGLQTRMGPVPGGD